MGTVIALSKSPKHTLIKKNENSISLIQGLGVEGDAHMGEKVKHRFDVRKNPNKPNLRQVHIIHSELHQELALKGFKVNPGEMGENITSSGIDLLNLPLNTILNFGETVKIKVTGLRKPCSQLNRIQEDLLKAVIEKGEDGAILFKAGVFGIVLQGGTIHVQDKITITLPQKPFIKLQKV